MTYEEILKRVLSKADSNVDTSEGSIFYDAIAPSCAEMALIYIENEDIKKQFNPVTADREYLILHAQARGLTPKEATHAVLKAEITPTTITLTNGDRFTLGNFSYYVSGTVDGGYMLTCEQTGSEPNGLLDDIIPVNYIQGLETAKLTAVLILGEDEEETEAFRTRYFSSFDAQSFGGNKADYLAKTNAIDGVGATKVTPVWNGGGTVKLTVLDSEYNKATDTLVATVQNVIDPTQDGTGIGLAPIGHIVTVDTAEEIGVSVSSTFTFDTSYSFLSLTTQINEAINAYLLELRKTWASSSELIVRIAQIDSRLLNITGILDVTNTTLNGEASNLTFSEYQIPILESVNENA